jgi:hypothetical protein
MIALRSAPAFDLGDIIMASHVKEQITEHGLDPVSFVNRHVHCDWGELSANDRRLNLQAIKCDERIVSAYKLGSDPAAGHLYVLTEADRSETTILLPEDCSDFH